jgi:hypothetical protein
MSIGFVLGNGISRLEVDVKTLQATGPVYGCNALYREHTPTVLVSTDKAISQEIQNSGYATKNRMYTRRPMPGLGAKTVPQNYFGFSSGPIAVGIAALDRNIAVYLIGFDMGPAQNNRFNNVYADTQFYKKSNSLPTYTGNWARQLATVIKDYPKISFYRVQGETTATVNELNGLANLRHMPVADFLNRINNTKDL